MAHTAVVVGVGGEVEVKKHPKPSGSLTLI